MGSRQRSHHGSRQGACLGGRTNQTTNMETIEIRFEIKRIWPTGKVVIYTLPIPNFNADIMNWSERKQRAFVLATWEAMRKQDGDRLVGFQIPVVKWRRFAVRPRK